MSKIDHFGGNLCESVRHEISGAVSLVGCMSGHILDAYPGEFLVTPIANCLPKEKGSARVCVLLGFEDNLGKTQQDYTIGMLDVVSLTQTYLPSDPFVFMLDKSGFIYLDAMELPTTIDIDSIKDDIEALKRAAIKIQRCVRIDVNIADTM